jgi:hypothetical protein
MHHVAPLVFQYWIFPFIFSVFQAFTFHVTIASATRGVRLPPAVRCMIRDKNIFYIDAADIYLGLRTAALDLDSIEAAKRPAITRVFLYFVRFSFLRVLAFLCDLWWGSDLPTCITNDLIQC